MKKTGRRDFLRSTTGLLAALGAPVSPAFVRSAGARGSGRPAADLGVQVGDLRGDSALLWSRTDRDTRMRVRWSTREDFSLVLGETAVHTLEDSDYTGKVLLQGLPAGETVFYCVDFLDLADYRTRSEPLLGHFRVAPADSSRDIRFLWSGDAVGQGWGINPDIGGLPIFRTMASQRPDFFIHSGDVVYADGPLQERIDLDDGRVWRNLVTPEKSKVAETLDEFRGQYRYNFVDEGLRDFFRDVPVFAQWDDHEVTNNWYWEKSRRGDGRYRESSVALLAARAMRAFHEYMPVRHHPTDPDRIYDRFRYGPALEVFRIDLRSYRGPNRDEQFQTQSPASRLLGIKQLEWLKKTLALSTATWKVIASDMPLGVVVYDDSASKTGAEAIGLRDGAPAGRELEIADLLRYLRDHEVKNVVWLTADVHYTAAHHYSPDRAQFQDFYPFWEFVSGPLHAGTFGGNRMDNSFGPEVVFRKEAPPGKANLSPLEGMQFFGRVDIDGESERMTVTLMDLAGSELYTTCLEPVGRTAEYSHTGRIVRPVSIS
ncbi:MAG: alkaline phosphatase D family protein [Pseudomonadales bacterium]